MNMVLGFAAYGAAMFGAGWFFGFREKQEKAYEAWIRRAQKKHRESEEMLRGSPARVKRMDVKPTSSDQKTVR